MSLIDDLHLAFINYPNSECQTEIVDFSISGGGGAVLNTGETFQFRIRVTNEGKLDMKNVTVRIEGTEYADIAPAVGPFVTALTTAPFTLHPSEQHTTVFYRGLAKKVTGPAKLLVKAKILTWDAGWDSLLNDSSQMAWPEGHLNKEISVE